MNFTIEKVGVFLLFILLFIAGLSVFTDAQSVLYSIDLFLFFTAVVLFLSGIFLWIFAWIFLLRKKHPELPVGGMFRLGFATVCGAVTPLQVGADYLRMSFTKKRYNVPKTASLAASLVSKGLKFGIIGLFSAVVVVWLLLSSTLDTFAWVSLVFGLLMIGLSMLFFLGPASKTVGMKLSRLFMRYEHNAVSAWFGKFYADYSKAFSGLTLSEFLFVFFLTAMSWFAEFLAIVFSFVSVGIYLPVFAFFILAIVIGILERVPLLPRGIGLVELAGYILLSTGVFTHAVGLATIGAALVVFDLVRLFIPSVLSFLALLMQKDLIE